jgi:hypothetical protein
VPLFVHLVLPGHEVVVRARGVAVEPGPALVKEVERLLGPGALAVDHA